MQRGLRHSAIGLAILAGGVMAAGVFALWHVVDERAAEHASSSIDHAVQMNSLLIREDAGNRLLAVGLIAALFHRLAARHCPRYECDWYDRRGSS